jgi:hypothetical protein
MSHISKYIDDDGLLYLWGKIKSLVSNALSNSGFYTKPSGGIPSSDLSSAVQTSLSKADTAVQSETVKSINTTAGTSGINLSLSNTGALDVTITSGSVTSGNTNFVTGDAVNTAIQNSISSITGITFEVVTSLPSTGQAGVIYLISNSGSGQNIYDEYIWVNNAFEKIGTANVDLSGYLQKTDYMSNSDMDTATNNWA